MRSNDAPDVTYGSENEPKRHDDVAAASEPTHDSALTGQASDATDAHERVAGDAPDNDAEGGRVASARLPGAADDADDDDEVLATHFWRSRSAMWMRDVPSASLWLYMPPPTPLPLDDSVAASEEVSAPQTILPAPEDGAPPMLRFHTMPPAVRRPPSRGLFRKRREEQPEWIRMPSVEGDTSGVFPAVGSRPRMSQKQMVKSTASGAALAGAGDFASAGLRYATNVAMTHMVAPGLYGIFVETIAAVTVLGYAAKIGLDSALLRFLATYRANGQRERVAGLTRFTVRLALLTGMLGGALFFLVSAALARAVYHKPVYEIPFKEAAILIPLVGMQLVLASGLQALREIKWKVLVDRLIQPTFAFLCLIVFYLMGMRLDGLLLAMACGYVASTLTGMLVLRKAVHRETGDVKPVYFPKRWLRFALPMSLNTLIRNVLNSTDVLFLGVFAATAQVGLYGAADRVSAFVIMPLIALNVMFSPLIAELHARHAHKRLASMFKLVTKWSFTLSWPIFLCCLLFHDTILGIFGPKYVAAGLVLIILAAGNLVDSGVGSVNYLLVMTGRPQVILLNNICSVVINIGLVLLLVPRFMMVGAALAAALAIIVLNIVALVEVYAILKIHPYRRDIFKPIAAGLVAALVGFVPLRLIHADYGKLAIVDALGMIVPFLAAYVLALWYLGFGEEDRLVFTTIQAKLGRKRLAPALALTGEPSIPQTTPLVAPVRGAPQLSHGQARVSRRLRHQHWALLLALSAGLLAGEGALGILGHAGDMSAAPHLIAPVLSPGIPGTATATSTTETASNGSSSVRRIRATVTPLPSPTARATATPTSTPSPSPVPTLVPTVLPAGAPNT